MGKPLPVEVSRMDSPVKDRKTRGYLRKNPRILKKTKFYRVVAFLEKSLCSV